MSAVSVCQSSHDNMIDKIFWHFDPDAFQILIQKNSAIEYQVYLLGESWGQTESRWLNVSFIMCKSNQTT